MKLRAVTGRPPFLCFVLSSGNTSHGVYGLCRTLDCSSCVAIQRYPVPRDVRVSPRVAPASPRRAACAVRGGGRAEVCGGGGRSHVRIRGGFPLVGGPPTSLVRSLVARAYVHQPLPPDRCRTVALRRAPAAPIGAGTWDQPPSPRRGVRRNASVRPPCGGTFGVAGLVRPERCVILSWPGRIGGKLP